MMSKVAVVPALDSAGFFVALYGGLFAKEGLHVHFTPATSSDTVISAQVKGQYGGSGGKLGWVRGIYGVS